MTEPSLIAEGDQLDVTTRDLLGSLGLRAVATWGPSEEYLATSTAEWYDRRLTLQALAATESDHVWLLVAIPTAEGGAIRHFVEAARDDGPPTGWKPTEMD